MDENIRVKIVLKNYGINITEMCRNLSWSREAFSRVANGHRALSVEKAKTIGANYGFSWTEFFTDPNDRYAQVSRQIDGCIVKQMPEKKFIELPTEWVKNMDVAMFQSNDKHAYNGNCAIIMKQTLTPDEVVKRWGNDLGLAFLVTTKRGQYYGSMYYDKTAKYTLVHNLHWHKSVSVTTSSIKYVQRIKAYLPKQHI